MYWWHHHGAVVVVPQGLLDGESYRKLRATLFMLAAEEPRAALVDVDGLRVVRPVALALFPAVRNHLDTWPGMPLLLVATRPEIREQLTAYRMARYLPVHTGLDAAVAGIGEPPFRELARVVLPPGAAAAVAAAATFVESHCDRWLVPDDRATDAIQVAGELVEHAIHHDHSAPTLRVELRSGTLTLAVYDGEPDAPPLADAVGAHGLTAVTRLSRTWGSTVTSDGGKIVWAAL